MNGITFLRLYRDVEYFESKMYQEAKINSLRAQLKNAEDNLQREYPSETPTPESQWPTEEEQEAGCDNYLDEARKKVNHYTSAGINYYDIWKAAIQWLQTSGVREGSHPVRHALSIANGDIDRLEASLMELVNGYESWEAELISDNRCWGPEGMNSYPTLTRELYDKMIELQGKRNEAKKLLSKTI